MTNEPGIIVLGAPRSGTTLLRRLLDTHPEISCPGETFLFKSCAQFLQSDNISMGFDYGTLGALEGLGFDESETKDRIRGFATSFYEDIAAKQGKKRWAAKTAIDSFYMDTIEALFKDTDTQFICITRHGLDVACSMEEFSRDLQSYITELHAYICEYPRPLEAFCHAWADVTSDILDFADRHNERCHVLKYEDLTNDTDHKLKQITDFLNVTAYEQKADDLLGRAKTDGIGDFKSYKKSNIDNASVQRFETQLQAPVIELLAPIVNPVLERAGYSPVDDGDNDDAQRRKELAQMMMQASDD